MWRRSGHLLGVVALAAAAIVASPLALAAPQETTDVALWRASELAQRDAALAGRIGADRSARETLADFGSHRFRLLRRDGDGFPEQHDHIVDVVIVQSGEGVLVLGGDMEGKRSGSTAGEYVGTSLRGGERRTLGPGDIVHIPPALPHAFLVPAGKHLTYVLVKFPGNR